MATEWNMIAPVDQGGTDLPLYSHLHSSHRHQYHVLLACPSDFDGRSFDKISRVIRTFKKTAILLVSADASAVFVDPHYHCITMCIESNNRQDH